MPILSTKRVENQLTFFMEMFRLTVKELCFYLTILLSRSFKRGMFRMTEFGEEIEPP